MKKIYNFINGVELLHLYGTYEQGEEEEGEVYEVLNIKTLKQATPNLRIINLYGIRWHQQQFLNISSKISIEYCRYKNIFHCIIISINVVEQLISFIDDSHIEAFSSNCIQLAVLCVNFCSKVKSLAKKIYKFQV